MSDFDSFVAPAFRNRWLLLLLKVPVRGGVTRAVVLRQFGKSNLEEIVLATCKADLSGLTMPRGELV